MTGRDYLSATSVNELAGPERPFWSEPCKPHSPMTPSLLSPYRPSGESHEAMTPEVSIDLCGEGLT